MRWISRVTIAMNSTAIVFSNNDLSSVQRIYPILHKSALDQIIWAVDGDRSIPDFILSHNSKTDIVSYSQIRLGKSNAYNRALKLIENENVFLISSDITFDSSIFQAILERIEDHGLAITNVTQVRQNGLIRKVGCLLWCIRDIQLRYFSENGIPIHGGEFLYIKRKFLERLPEVVNDDAYQCLIAQKNGARGVYFGDLEVKNFVPSTLTDLIQQRRRINYGHIQIGKKLEKPSSVSFMVLNNTGGTLAIFKKTLKRNKRWALIFPILILIEIIAKLSAYIDVMTSHDQILWKNIETSKS